MRTRVKTFRGPAIDTFHIRFGEDSSSASSKNVKDEDLDVDEDEAGEGALSFLEERINSWAKDKSARILSASIASVTDGDKYCWAAIVVYEV